MPITPYFFYAQKDLAQRLTNTLCISIGNINIYIELDKRMLNIQTLIRKTQYLPYSDTIAGRRYICHRVYAY